MACMDGRHVVSPFSTSHGPYRISRMYMTSSSRLVGTALSSLGSSTQDGLMPGPFALCLGLCLMPLRLVEVSAAGSELMMPESARAVWKEERRRSMQKPWSSRAAHRGRQSSSKRTAMAHILRRIGASALLKRKVGDRTLPPLISGEEAMQLREQFYRDGQ